MKVEQVAEIVNSLSSGIIGEGAPQVAVDLSDVVSVGKALFDATSVDNYVRKLVDHIGKMIFVDRPYSGRAPSVMMDGWEFGSILEKVDAGIPEAEINPSWNLQNGQTYNQDEFNGPKDVIVLFFNDKVTFQIPMSFAEEQVKSAFSNGLQLNAFFSMIFTKIETGLTIRLDSLIQATVNNFIGNVYLYGKPAQKRNLLAEFNAQVEASEKITTPALALTNQKFLQFAALQFLNLSDRLPLASVAFNIGGRVRHTPKGMQKILMLDSFANGANVYLQSETFHNELTRLPEAERVSFWQFTGTKFDFEDTSSIDIIPNTSNGKGPETKVSGILSVVFDRDALGVNNMNRRTTNHYNALGEFINFWYKMDAQYFNDFNENFVLFYIEAEPEPEPEPTE